MADDQQPDARAWARTRARREFAMAIGRKLAEWRILRVRNGHYYSPVPSVKEMRGDAERIFNRSLGALPGFDLQETEQLALLTEFAEFYSEQPFSETPQARCRYFFDNYYFGHADALFLYSMLRVIRPHRVVEIGSGFSSAVMLDTNEHFMDRRVQFTFVEPDSKRLRTLLKKDDYASVSIIEKRIQDVDSSIVAELVRGDIIFVDSSHVSKVGSDVNHIVFELLPKLAPGVIVHFHDVLYPFEYPKEWFELGFSWNEAYILRAFLQSNTEFRLKFWNDFMVRFHSEEIQKVMPSCLDRPRFGIGGSLWIEKA
jgi:predicted O-methyltransferase YrrM